MRVVRVLLVLLLLLPSLFVTDTAPIHRAAAKVIIGGLQCCCGSAVCHVNGFGRLFTGVLLLHLLASLCRSPAELWLSRVREASGVVSWPEPKAKPVGCGQRGKPGTSEAISSAAAVRCRQDVSCIVDCEREPSALHKLTAKRSGAESTSV